MLNHTVTYHFQGTVSMASRLPIHNYPSQSQAWIAKKKKKKEHGEKFKIQGKTLEWLRGQSSSMGEKTPSLITITQTRTDGRNQKLQRKLFQDKNYIFKISPSQRNRQAKQNITSDSSWNTAIKYTHNAGDRTSESTTSFRWTTPEITEAPARHVAVNKQMEKRNASSQVERNRI